MKVGSTPAKNALLPLEPVRTRPVALAFPSPRRTTTENADTRKGSTSVAGNSSRPPAPQDIQPTENMLPLYIRSSNKNDDQQQDEIEHIGTTIDGTGAADPDVDALSALLEADCRDNNIFELLLPEGRSLRVAVEHDVATIRLMLWPSPVAFRKKLIEKKKELQEGLERRMSGSLTLTLFDE